MVLRNARHEEHDRHRTDDYECEEELPHPFTVTRYSEERVAQPRPDASCAERRSMRSWSSRRRRDSTCS